MSTETEATKAPSKIVMRKAALLLGALIVIAFAASLKVPFQFDDYHSIQDNLSIRSLGNFAQFWTDPATSSELPDNRVYRPMVYTLYSFCWAIGKGSVVPFHVMKLIMHFIVCMSLFLVWRRLWSEKGWLIGGGMRIKLPLYSKTFTINAESAALLVASIFAIHPAISECVNYIAATTSLQCAMFYLLAFQQYLSFRDTGERKALHRSLLFYFLSVMTKQEGITLPAMVFVAELFLNAGSAKERVKKSFSGVKPYAAAGLFCAFILFKMHPPEGDRSRGGASPWEYFITQWRAYLWYMRIWFWPWELNADNVAFEFSRSITDPRVIQAAIGNLALLALGWINRRRAPAILFGLLWFYITISPASSIVPLAEAVNEHRMYLAYFGFAGTASLLFLAALGTALSHHGDEEAQSSELQPKALGYIIAAIAIGLFAGTQERNRVWGDVKSLWEDTIEKNPMSTRAYNNLALHYMRTAEYPKALELLEKCEKASPTYVYCHLNKSIVYGALKNIDAAEASMVRAQRLNPNNIYVAFYLGKFYEETKKDDAKAKEWFRRADEMTAGRYVEAKIHLASIALRQGALDEARSLLDRIAQLEPGRADANDLRKKLGTPATQTAAKQG